MLFCGACPLTSSSHLNCWFTQTPRKSLQPFVVVQLQSYVQLFCSLLDCSPPGSSVHGISQARILEWVVTFFSRGIFRTQASKLFPALQVNCLPLRDPGSPFNLSVFSLKVLLLEIKITTILFCHFTGKNEISGKKKYGPQNLYTRGYFGITPQYFVFVGNIFTPNCDSLVHFLPCAVAVSM